MGNFPWPASIICLLFAGLVFRRLNSAKRPPFPPGPPGLPILRNFFDFPYSYDWLTYGKWADQYGPVISLSAFGTHIVVINTYKKAMEMLDKKSAKYSARPYVPMAVDLMGWGKAMSFTFGPKFRGYRKVFHEELGNPRALQSFWPREELHARKFIANCLETPEKLMEHSFQHAGAIILRVAYGYVAKDQDDEFVRAGNIAMESFNEGTSPSKFMVNQMPLLRFVPEWVPGAGFQTWARLRRHLYSDMVEIPFTFVKRELAKGTAEDSFTAKWLKKQLSPEQEEILKHAAGSMFGGGSETTAIIVQMFFLAMALHPEVQRKAQAEMDAVVGCERLPSYEDRDKLPYLEALLKEVMRIYPVVPNGLPHATSEEDIHDGFYIPKSAIVVPNIWKISRDAVTYSSPDDFNPGRFLGPEPELDPRNIVFEFGRRVCPGRLLADASVYITMAMCIAAFSINAEENTPLMFKGDGNIVNRLEPFEVELKPRVEKSTLINWLKA